MTATVERRTPEETRTCIMQVAWDLFRELGPRTTIADVADKAGMSSANVYRFFPSKQALTEEVCQSLLAELLKAARAAIDSPGTPSERIAALMMTLHRLMRYQMTAGNRAYEIVEVALEQKWQPIIDYLHKCAGMLAEAIADGQASGEFGPGDPLQLGWMTMQSCTVIHDPTLIPSCTVIRPEAKPEEAVEFALRALTNKHPPPQLRES
ncbi:MAG: TetR/AcrR family transcriptional regulator [Hyphomicrobiales bacterium]|nr:TetR/AcrR family transcriptional regulator [Hyphomicrobiales bacterium]